jgi:hypothetical protein
MTDGKKIGARGVLIMTNATPPLLFKKKKNNGGLTCFNKKHVLALQLTGVSKYGHGRKTGLFSKGILRFSFSYPTRQTNNN